METQMERSHTQQDPRFLLRRIDPSKSNERIRHGLMGETLNNNSEWVQYGTPVIRDKELLHEVMGMIERFVNPELRLGKFTKDEARKDCEIFGHELNELFMKKGTKEIEDPIENYNPQNRKDEKFSNMAINPDYWTQAIFTLTSYVYGNLTRAIEGREGNLIKNVISHVEKHVMNDEKKGIKGIFT